MNPGVVDVRVLQRAVVDEAGIVAIGIHDGTLVMHLEGGDGGREAGTKHGAVDNGTALKRRCHIATYGTEVAATVEFAYPGMVNLEGDIAASCLVFGSHALLARSGYNAEIAAVEVGMGIVGHVVVAALGEDAPARAVYVFVGTLAVGEV